MAELDLVANLLNKIQFTFESCSLLDFRSFQMIFRRCASILAQCYKGVSGWEEREGGEGGRGRRGGEVGREVEKTPGENTR